MHPSKLPAQPAIRGAWHYHHDKHFFLFFHYAPTPGVSMLTFPAFQCLLQRIWQSCVSSGVTWLAMFNGRAVAETIFSISLTWHELTHHGRSAQDAGGLKRPMLYHW